MKKRAVALLTISLALAACGGSDSSSSEASDAANEATATSAATRTKNAALPATTVAKRATPTTLAPRATPTTLAPRATPTTVKPSTATPTTKAPAATAAPATLAPVTVPATGPNACTAAGPCKVGQTGPAGGIVFYAAATPQPWGQYMEVRPELFEQIVADTCNLSAFDTYAAGAIGDGIKQMNAVIAACAKDGKPAAAGSYARVDAYKQNGFDDWFIPSKDELQALLASKAITFGTDKDLSSGTWAMKPKDSASRGFDVLWGVKKESLAATLRPGATYQTEIMSDGSQSYGNANNRWGWIHIARSFGPKA